MPDKSWPGTVPIYRCFLAACVVCISCASNSAWAKSAERAIALCRQGTVFFEGNKFKQAQICFDQAIQADPDQPWGYQGRGRALQKLDQPEEALKDFNKLVSLSPNHAENYSLRGRVYTDLGKPKPAIADLNKAIELAGPKASWSLYQDRALLQDMLGQSDKAIVDSSEALRRKPDWLWGYQFRASIYYKLGRYKEAVADLTSATKLHSNAETIKIYTMRADCYDKIGKHDLALKDRKYADTYVKGSWADSMLAPAADNPQSGKRSK